MVSEITVPRYITKVQLSRKRRPKYYKSGEKIPKKYSDYQFDTKGFLIDPEGNKLIKNKAFVDKPRFQILSGNNLISGYGSPHIRAKLARELKNFYRPFLLDYVKEHGPIENFPLKVEWDVYTVNVREGTWDASNLYFYYKYFEDTAVDVGLIPDDCVKYITWSPGAKIIPVENWDDRKFVFRFIHETRNEILNEFS